MDRATLNDDPKVRQRRIATLPEVPGFLELIEDLEEAEQRAWQRLTTEMRGGATLDQRAVDEMRGVAKAIRLLRKGPEKAASQLDKQESEA